MHPPPETYNYNYLIHALLSLNYPPPHPALHQSVITADDTITVVEEKRRRNTAASARFRVKKKLKKLSLERTVADLTGRTEELEREAADLQRENVWLKEILLLKGRNLAGLHALAPANRPDESETESTANPKEKGKDKQC